MRTTLTIDDDLYEEANALSKLSGKRLGEVVSQLMRKGLDNDPPTSELPDDDYPFITFPPTGGKKIRMTDILRAQQEEWDEEAAKARGEL